MNLQFLDPLADADWDRRLAELGGVTSFHSRAWAGVLVQTYGFARCYAAIKSQQEIHAVLPLMEVRCWRGGKKAVALPFSDHVPVAAVSAVAADDLMRQLSKAGCTQGWHSLELRTGSAPGGVDAPPAARYYRHELELLSDEAAMFKRFKATVRTAIRKAETSGVHIVRGHGADRLADFCRLNERTRRRHGLPPQPASFFRAVGELLLQPGAGEIWVAMLAGKVIAAALFLVHRGQAIFKYGCSDRQFQQYRANDLLMWRVICDLARRGLRSLCMGRTDLPHEGLRRFKLGFGASEKALDYWTYDYGRAAYCAAPPRRSGWYHHVFCILPLWANRGLGNLIYRFAA